MIKKLGLRFRSVSFRAGLTTALIVGAIVAIPAFVVIAGLLAFGSQPDFTAVNEVGQLLEEGTPAEDALSGVVSSDVSVIVIYDVNGTRLSQIGTAPPNIDIELQSEIHRVGEITSADVYVTIGLIGGWTVVNTEFEGPDGDVYVVAAADEQEISRLIALVPALLTIVVALSAGAIAAWSVRKSLRKVDLIQTEVQQIKSTSLDRRLPTREVADPIDRLPHTMNDMLDRLERSQQQQNRFVADASHELRSPIAGILAQLEVATEYPDKVDVHGLLPKLHAEASRSQVIIDDLLYLSRLEGGEGITVNYITLPVGIEVVRAEVERRQIFGQRAAVNLDKSRLIYDDESIDSLKTSKSHLARIVQNLTENATRYCDEKVMVSLKVDPPTAPDRSLIVSVVDDGPGIEPKDRQHIFDRFVRLDEARSRDKGGSGLGLSITKELVNHAGGSIRVVDSSNADYKGANFEVRLPLHVVL